MTDRTQPTASVLTDALLAALDPATSVLPQGWMMPLLYRHEAEAAVAAQLNALMEAGYAIVRSEPMTEITLPVSLEAILDPAPPHWLSGAPWTWEIRGPRGNLLANGEGCRTAAVAIETARITAYEEGWIGVSAP